MDYNKGIPDLLGTNLTYLLRLGQFSSHKYLPSIWKGIVETPKCQHLTTIQRVIDDTVCCLNIRAPIVMTSGLLKLTVDLGFCLDHRDALGMGLHQFGMVQNTSAA